MRGILTMMQRELGAYFLSPIAYVVLAIFLFTSGLVFGLAVFEPGGEASLRALLGFWMIIILVFVLPMLTMRLFSEELRSGTIETLMTAPITEVQVVLGKFLGAFVFYVLMLAAMAVYPIVLAAYGNLDSKLLACNFLGLLLLGALYISVGLFFSACSRHQIIAVLVSFVLLAIMTFASYELAQVVEKSYIRIALQHLSIRAHFNDFVRGAVDTNHLVFFLTTTMAFLFFTVKKLEMRRWQ